MTTPQLNPLAQATSNIVVQYSGKVWGTADTLRGVGAKASEWPNHMMPFFALMLLESRALRARNQALAKFGGSFDPTDKDDVEDLKAAYISEAGASSQTYHEDLIIHGQGLAHATSGGASGFSQRLRAYLNGYDDTTQRLLGVNPGESKVYLNISGTIRYLEGKGGEHLWHYCDDWSKVDLTQYDSSAITTLEEHIKRKWADISADTAGEHYTPADLIELVSAIVVDHFARHPIERSFLRIYDPTCGGGNMLFGVEDHLRKADHDGKLLNAKGDRYSIQSFGQELNDTLFSLAAIESRFRAHAVIKEGNTLTDDAFQGEKFDVIVANPPYGTEWKPIQKEINSDKTGRFPDGCRPPVSDGQHLFLQHIQHHLADDGLALVFCSGSTLFSGDAGGGESNARSKYILTDDGVWGIIQLPKNEFFNTGINTYVWIFKKCKPEQMKNRMFLLNAETLFAKMRKSLGNKNSEITTRNRDTIVKLIASVEDPTIASKLLDDGMVLTVDVANRMDPKNSLSGVRAALSEDGDELLVLESDEKKAAFERLNAIYIKAVPQKETTADEPALLRLFDSEQVHYNKVIIEAIRGGEEAFSRDPITLKKAALRIFIEPATLENSNPRSLWISSNATPEEARSGLELARCEGLLAIEPIATDDGKAVVAAIKQALEALPFKAFEARNEVATGFYAADEAQNTIAGYSWRLHGEEEQVIDTSAGKALGIGCIDVKVKVAKGNKKDPTERLVIEAEVGPRVEKDTETTPYRRDAAANQEVINQFLGRWVRDRHIILYTTVGCEVNFNRLFPKTAERKSLSQVNYELAALDAQLASLWEGSV